MITNGIKYVKGNKKPIKDKIDTSQSSQHQTILDLLKRNGEIKTIDEWRKEFDKLMPTVCQKIDSGNQL